MSPLPVSSNSSKALYASRDDGVGQGVVGKVAFRETPRENLKSLPYEQLLVAWFPGRQPAAQDLYKVPHLVSW